MGVSFPVAVGAATGRLPAPTAATPPSRVAVSGLTKVYGATRRALSGVTFELADGLTGLLGPNGAGKSTLISCLAGISPWDHGSVILDGIDAERDPTGARRRVGYMPERVAFPYEMRVEEYLRFVASTAKGIPRSKRRAAVETALVRAELIEVHRRVIGNLSKGYRQRVGLAQALLGDPPVLLLDELMAGLDPLNLCSIRTTLTDYAADHAVVLSTHTLSEARQLCEKLLVLSSGNVIYTGPTSEMRGGATRRVRLRVGPATGRSLCAFLETSGNAPVQVVSDREVILEVSGEEALGELSQEIVRAGYAVVALEAATDALEDAFREAVMVQAMSGDTDQ